MGPSLAADLAAYVGEPAAAPISASPLLAHIRPVVRDLAKA
ncbi:hypothetical protein DFR69_103216 [Nocardia neocaledoniensis]|uniref:Uncharacterized protein n=1 Tax=Nocardia neocaledoniensis TaxID=236511 RepID=A0A317NRL8_9NOCA|nr:hypothetical protein DFR69_103216 [Nocardia neocaledoniensis]